MSGEDSDLIIKAVPLWRPLNELVYLTRYQVDNGDLINVPLGSRSVPACVISRQGERKDGLKEIGSIIETSAFPQSLIDICAHLAHKHSACLGQTLGLALPHEIMRPPRKPTPQASSRRLRELKLRVDEKKIFDFFLRSAKPVLVNSSADYTGLVVRMVREMICKGKQTLLLFPHEPSLSRFWKRFRPYLSLTLYHAAQGQKEKRQTWHGINKGGINIIAGLRSAVLLPFRNLGLIMVFEEDCDSHRVRSHHVHYDARELALYRGRLEKASVALFSPAPRLETTHRARSGGLFLIERKGKQQGKAMIVDLKNHHGDKVLSSTLMKEITETYRRNMKSVLLLNRLGTAARMICIDCGNVLTCSECAFPFKFIAAGQELTCPICGKSIKPPDRCPQCEGSNWQPLSPGLTTLHSELRKIVPGQSICKITSENKPVLDQVENARVIYGTSALLEYLPSRVQTAAFLSWDAERSRPHFRSTERAFRDMLYLRRMLASTPESRLVVQTFRPKDPVISWALKADYQRFFSSEVKRRRELGYPPYNTLILFEKTTSSKVWSDEKLIAEISGEGVQIMGPYTGPHRRDTLLIKLRRDIDPGNLLDAATLKKSGWQAEVDPTEII